MHLPHTYHRATKKAAKRPVYPSLVLNSYGTDLMLASTQTVATIGFLLDYFMTEVNNEFTKEHTNIITHQRDVVLFDMMARGLSLTHRPFNAVEISSSDLDITEIPRRINSTNIFTSKGDDFDNLVLSLASFPPVFIIVGDPLSQIGASEMIFLVNLNRNNG